MTGYVISFYDSGDHEFFYSLEQAKTRMYQYFLDNFDDNYKKYPNEIEDILAGVRADLESLEEPYPYLEGIAYLYPAEIMDSPLDEN